ncbi:hypothetical protein ZYGNAAKF_CDS0153 [Enterococcus phage VRE9_2]
MLLNIFYLAGLIFCGYIYIMFIVEEFLKSIRKRPYRRK